MKDLTIQVLRIAVLTSSNNDLRLLRQRFAATIQLEKHEFNDTRSSASIVGQGKAFAPWREN